ncbi:hypothetical protein [Nocardia niwae]|uniref:hypothetical protein n=1 Tax=Nocardia niwae TaxID=626084 RepID=UPI0007A5656C|nr:hypothetical protein [Nocardia niwae]
MSYFEIHGDDENGVTVRVGDLTRTFYLVHWGDRPGEVALRFTHGSYAVPDVWRFELDLIPHPESIDATPTVYGEGVWLH